MCPTTYLGMEEEVSTSIRLGLKFRQEKELLISNFCKGTTGNPLAMVNPQDGEISQNLSGSSFGGVIDDAVNHSVTGETVSRHQTPDVARVKVGACSGRF